MRMSWLGTCVKLERVGDNDERDIEERHECFEIYVIC